MIIDRTLLGNKLGNWKYWINFLSLFTKWPVLSINSDNTDDKRRSSDKVLVTLARKGSDKYLKRIIYLLLLGDSHCTLIKNNQFIAQITRRINFSVDYVWQVWVIRVCCTIIALAAMPVKPLFILIQVPIFISKIPIKPIHPRTLRSLPRNALPIKIVMV